MDIQDIQVFESEKKIGVFFTFPLLFFLEDGDGRKNINPIFWPQKGNCHREPDDKLLDVPSFSHHFPIIFQHFPMDFLMDFPVSGSHARPGARQITWRATAFAVALENGIEAMDSP